MYYFFSLTAGYEKKSDYCNLIPGRVWHVISLLVLTRKRNKSDASCRIFVIEMSCAKSRQLCSYHDVLTAILFLQESRVKYNQQNYRDVFHTKDSQETLDNSSTEPSLLMLVEVRVSIDGYCLSFALWGC